MYDGEIKEHDKLYELRAKAEELTFKIDEKTQKNCYEIHKNIENLKEIMNSCAPLLKEENLKEFIDGARLVEDYLECLRYSSKKMADNILKGWR